MTAAASLDPEMLPVLQQNGKRDCLTVVEERDYVLKTRDRGAMFL